MVVIFSFSQKMVKIISQQGYPQDDELLMRVDYFVRARPCEGGILIVGKDSQSREYKPKNETTLNGSYLLPSGTQYSVAVGNEQENHPALYFPFQLNCGLTSSEIVAKADADEDFFDALEMRVMDDFQKQISLSDGPDKLFKFVVGYAVLELADITVRGGVRNHFWGEIYIPRTSEIEKLLETYRG